MLLTTTETEVLQGSLSHPAVGDFPNAAPRNRQLLTEARVRFAVRFALVAGVMAVASFFTNADLDMFHEMALFREALRTGAVPAQDVFAFTPTVNPSIHHEWGTGAILYLAAVASGMGAPGLMLLKYSLMAVLFVVSFMVAKLRGASEAAIAVLAPTAGYMGLVGFSTVRAQLFTLVFFACLLYFIELDRRGHQLWVLAWLPIYAVWLNVHGGFVVGLGVFGLYAAERFVRAVRKSGVSAAGRQVSHLVLAALAMLPLVLVNPYGWDYVPYLWHAIAMDRPLITEWRPLWHSAHHAVLLPVFVVSLLPVLYAATRRGVRNLPGLLILAVTAYLAFQHVRHLSIYAVVFFCYAPGYIRGTEIGRMVRCAWRNHRAPIFAIALAWGAFGVVRSVQERFWQLEIPNVTTQPYRIGFPSGAVSYLADQRFVGNLITPFEAGAFVSWKLHPAVKVSIDSRYEVAYPREALAEHNVLYAGQQGWERSLRRYAADGVLTPRVSALDSLLASQAHSEEWRRVYVDDGFSVFLRSQKYAELPVADRRGQEIRGRFP